MRGLVSLVSMLSTDVLVVGAGPAGTAAAIELRRQGRDVIVIDKATFPRDKCCGDGLTTLALRELESLGLDPASLDGWHDVHSAWLRSPGGRHGQLHGRTDRGQIRHVHRREERGPADLDATGGPGR